MNANYSDTEYCDSGAFIVETATEVYTADIVLKATSVSLPEARLMHDKQIILSPLKLFDLRKEAVMEMMQKKVTALGFDFIKDEDGFYPVMRIDVYKRQA